MKRLVSTALTVALLLGLGALAVLARGGGDILAPVSEVALAAPQTAAEPDATLSSRYNMIAVPLDVQTNWAGSTPAVPFNSQGLAQYIGLSSVTQVLHWDRTRQAYDQWLPQDDPPSGSFGGEYTETPYDLEVGDVYRILLNSADTSLDVVTFVGNVPDANSITFTLTGATACKYNQISIPLEQADINDAQELAVAMGGPDVVAQVLRWDAARQAYDQWLPGDDPPSGTVGGEYTETPYSVQIGYPYVVCLRADANDVEWPQ